MTRRGGDDAEGRNDAKKNSDDCEALFFLASLTIRSQRNARGCGNQLYAKGCRGASLIRV